MAIGTGIGLLVSGLVGGAGQIYGAKKQGSAAKDAQRIAERTQKRTEAYERELETRRRQEYDQSIVLQRQQHEAEQAELNRQAVEEQRRFDMNTAEDLRRYEAKETRMAPYREAGVMSLRDLAARASQPTAPGVPLPPQRDLMAGHINNQPGVVTMRELASGAQQAPPTSGFTLDVADLDPRWRRQ